MMFAKTSSKCNIVLKIRKKQTKSSHKIIQNKQENPTQLCSGTEKSQYEEKLIIHKNPAMPCRQGE